MTATKFAPSGARPPAQPRPAPIKLMVIGDSISHGAEGDFTWRYRLWEWIRAQDLPITFVGPWHGTAPPATPSPPRPPPFQDELADADLTRVEGGYACTVDPSFTRDGNDAHLALGGWQARLAVATVREQVAAYAPHLLLIELGINDLNSAGSGPDEALDRVRHVVSAARESAPGVSIAIANVPVCTESAGRADLALVSRVYNSMLEAAVPWWSTEASRVELVHLAENYESDVEGAPATYDGLHPNALGEYQIAQAFTRTLVRRFGLGDAELAIPRSIPARPNPTPTGLAAVPTAAGIVVTWDAVYGCFGYELQLRRPDLGTEWNQIFLLANRHDLTRCPDGETWEFRVRARAGSSIVSPWSSVVDATAHPNVAPGPSNVFTRSTARGFIVYFDPPVAPPAEDGRGKAWEVERYGVLFLDRDTPDAWQGVFGIHGSGEEVFENVVVGHRYSVAVETWTTDGAVGTATGGPDVVAGG